MDWTLVWTAVATIVTIIASNIALIGWVRSDIKSLSDRIDKLDAKINDIDKRVFGIETMLHMKDCCMLKDDRQIKKAE